MVKYTEFWSKIYNFPVDGSISQIRRARSLWTRLI